MATDNVETNPLEQDMQQVCPRCNSSEVMLEVPETLTFLFRPAPLSTSMKSTATGSRYFRFKCDNCKLSTRNHVNAAAATDEWIALIKHYKEEPQ